MLSAGFKESIVSCSAWKEDSPAPATVILFKLDPFSSVKGWILSLMFKSPHWRNILGLIFLELILIINNEGVGVKSLPSKIVVSLIFLLVKILSLLSPGCIGEFAFLFYCLEFIQWRQILLLAEADCLPACGLSRRWSHLDCRPQSLLRCLF